jgi:hypothetical protein
LFAGSGIGGRRIPRVLDRQGAGERLREVDESSRQLNSAIDRASRFLNLASLASVLLAAVAVAMGARRYAIASHRYGGVDEVHGRLAALRIVDFHHRIDAAGGCRRRRSARCSDISRRAGLPGCCAI